MTDQLDIYEGLERWQLRNLALLRRGGEEALCDLCRKNRATDYHEIVARNRTNAHSPARMISYQPELCSFLCHDCHMSYHHQEFSPELRDQLWQVNYVIFGKGAVQAAFAVLEGVMKTKLGWRLPE